jgi:hypothetical protein
MREQLMSVKSEMVNGAKPYQVRTGRPVKDETDLRGDATPRMPHERDESDDSQEAGGVREDIQQAYKDVMSGQKDTDCREGRGVEQTVAQKDELEQGESEDASTSKPSPVENPKDRSRAQPSDRHGR